MKLNKKNKKKKKTKAIVQISKTYAIDKPSQMIQAAKQIKEYIVKNDLSVQIVGKDYVMVEGWQFAGSLMSLFPRIVKVESLKPNEWMAQAEIVNRKTKEVVGTGFALCSKSEMKKASFDEYAILSMAQTRAIGKAFRNVIGWVIKLAGYESTPGEEIKGKKEPPKENIDLIGKAGDLPASDADKKRIADMCKKMGAESARDVAQIIKKKTGKVYNFGKLTKNEASQIIFKLLQ